MPTRSSDAIICNIFFCRIPCFASKTFSKCRFSKGLFARLTSLCYSAGFCNFPLKCNFSGHLLPQERAKRHLSSTAPFVSGLALGAGRRKPPCTGRRKPPCTGKTTALVHCSLSWHQTRWQKKKPFGGAWRFSRHQTRWPKRNLQRTPKPGKKNPALAKQHQSHTSACCWALKHRRQPWHSTLNRYKHQHMKALDASSHRMVHPWHSVPHIYPATAESHTWCASGRKPGELVNTCSQSQSAQTLTCWVLLSLHLMSLTHTHTIFRAYTYIHAILIFLSSISVSRARWRPPNVGSFCAQVQGASARRTFDELCTGGITGHLTSCLSVPVFCAHASWNNMLIIGGDYICSRLTVADDLLSSPQQWKVEAQASRRLWCLCCPGPEPLKTTCATLKPM